jgi:glyoxylase-like metal-dependent hydrolase (beta-lactamase superfamily II)
MNPHLVMRDVAADPSLATDRGLAVIDGVAFHAVEVADPVYPLTLFIGVNTGRIARLSTMASDPLLRDVAVDVHYADWTPAPGGLQFPLRVALTVDGEILLEETRGSVEANVALDAADFAFPDGAAPSMSAEDAARGAMSAHYHQEFSGIGLRPVFDGLQTNVVATEVAPGVFHLTGGTHHSMAVEQNDRVVLVEGPLYDARSAALLDWTASQFPGKPVSHVISTHFHIDHSGGLRELVAAGATLVAGEASEPLYRRVLAAPSKLVPDGLEANPTDASLMLVPESGITLTDATHPVHVRRLVTGHAADMVIVELVNDEIIFESDLFNPGGVNFVELQKLLREDMIANGRTSYTIVGGHGTGPATFADLEAAITAQ